MSTEFLLNLDDSSLQVDLTEENEIVITVIDFEAASITLNKDQVKRLIDCLQELIK